MNDIISLFVQESKIELIKMLHSYTFFHLHFMKSHSSKKNYSPGLEFLSRLSTHSFEIPNWSYFRANGL